MLYPCLFPFHLCACPSAFSFVLCVAVSSCSSCSCSSISFASCAVTPHFSCPFLLFPTLQNTHAYAFHFSLPRFAFLFSFLCFCVRLFSCFPRILLCQPKNQCAKIPQEYARAAFSPCGASWGYVDDCGASVNAMKIIKNNIVTHN